ncbi:MAG: hypothetical protein ACO3A2_11405 [Bdellovibrionia bacterium]
MKTFIFFHTFLLVLAPRVWAGSNSESTNAPQGEKACSVGCGAYEAKRKLLETPSGCGPKTADLSLKPVIYNGNVYREWNQCKDAFLAPWTMSGLDARCAAWKLYKKAEKIHYDLEIAYASIAALCFAIPIDLFGKACGVGFAGTMGGDLGATKAFANSAKDEATIITENATTKDPVAVLSTSSGDTTQPFSIVQLADRFHDILKEKERRQAIELSTLQLDYTGKVIGGFAAFYADLNAKEKKKKDQAGKTQCAEALKIGFPGKNVDSGARIIGDTSSADGRMTGEGGGTSGTGGNGAANFLGGEGAEDDPSKNLNEILASAATAGPLGELKSAFSDLSKVPSLLDQQGVNLRDLIKRIDQGDSLAAPYSSVPGISGGVLEALNEIEPDLNRANLRDRSAEEAFKLSGADSIMTASGGGKSPASSSSAAPFDPSSMAALFGQKAPTTGTTSSAELQFGGRSSASVNGQSSDIWHTGMKASMFQIVSSKLDQVRDRVHREQWASPLNRALNGLSALTGRPSSHSSP